MKARVRSLGPRLAALAGGVVFAGAAGATDVIKEDFESPPPGIWSAGFGTYTTDQDFSASPHGVVPDGGQIYSHLIGIPNTLTLFTFNIADTLTASEQQAVNAGTAVWNFEAWLAAWTSDADYTEFSVEWFDAAGGTGSSLGVDILADGSSPMNVTRVVHLGVIEEDATNWNEDNWSFYETNGTVPRGAVSAIVRYDGKSSGASNTNDAYADNVLFTVGNSPSPPRIRSIAVGGDGMITLEWDSILGALYGLDSSGDLQNWSELDDGLEGEDATTAVTFEDSSRPEGAERRFYRIRELGEP